MTTLKSQLPFEIYPTDDECLEIEDFSITCPECKKSLDESQLSGEIDHDTIKKALIKIDCACVHCGGVVKQTYRIELEESKSVIYQLSQGTWKKIDRE